MPEDGDKIKPEPEPVEGGAAGEHRAREDSPGADQDTLLDWAERLLTADRWQDVCKD